MDPRERLKWIDLIIERLFKADIKRLNSEITELNRKNQIAHQDLELAGFILNSVTYMDRTMYQQQINIANRIVLGDISARYKPLHEKLAKEADAFNKTLDLIGKDREEIKQLITLLLGQIRDHQELRDCIPDVIIHLIPDLPIKERKIQDCTYMIRSNKYAMKAYERSIEKLESYSVMNMLI